MKSITSCHGVMSKYTQNFSTKNKWPNKYLAKLAQTTQESLHSCIALLMDKATETCL